MSMMMMTMMMHGWCDCWLLLIYYGHANSVLTNFINSTLAAFLASAFSPSSLALSRTIQYWYIIHYLYFCFCITTTHVHTHKHRAVSVTGAAATLIVTPSFTLPWKSTDGDADDEYDDDDDDDNDDDDNEVSS